MSSIEFSAHSAPPTQEQIAASQASLRKKSFSMRGAGVVQAALSAMCVLLTLSSEWGSTSHGISMVLSFVFVLSALFTFDSASDVGDKVETLNPLARKSCPTMLQLCCASESGRRYQQAVITQGRSFVEAEFKMMSEAVGDATQEAACKQLHGIPA